MKKVISRDEIILKSKMKPISISEEEKKSKK